MNIVLFDDRKSSSTVPESSARRNDIQCVYSYNILDEKNRTQRGKTDEESTVKNITRIYDHADGVKYILLARNSVSYKNTSDIYVPECKITGVPMSSFRNTV